MSSLSRSLAYITRTVLQVQATKTASFTSTPVDLSAVEGLILITLKAFSTNGGASAPTMLCKLTTCETVGGSYTDVTGVTTTAAAASDLEFVVDKNKLKRFVLIDGTIGGTSTPTFAVSGEAHYWKKYVG